MPKRLNTVLSEIMRGGELQPYINHMPVDEAIAVLGKLEAIKIMLADRIRYHDPNHIAHSIIRSNTEVRETVMQSSHDELVDVNQASRRLGYSKRWLYNNADSLPFTVRQKSGRLRFSVSGIDAYLKSGKPKR